MCISVWNPTLSRTFKWHHILNLDGMWSLSHLSLLLSHLSACSNASVSVNSGPDEMQMRYRPGETLSACSSGSVPSEEVVAFEVTDHYITHFTDNFAWKYIWLPVLLAHVESFFKYVLNEKDSGGKFGQSAKPPSRPSFCWFMSVVRISVIWLDQVCTVIKSVLFHFKHRS